MLALCKIIRWLLPAKILPVVWLDGQLLCLIIVEENQVQLARCYKELANLWRKNGKFGKAKEFCRTSKRILAEVKSNKSGEVP